MYDSQMGLLTIFMMQSASESKCIREYMRHINPLMFPSSFKLTGLVLLIIVKNFFSMWLVSWLYWGLVLIRVCVCVKRIIYCNIYSLTTLLTSLLQSRVRILDFASNQRFNSAIFVFPGAFSWMANSREAVAGA